MKERDAMQSIARFPHDTPSASEIPLPDGWKTWSPRPEIAPTFTVESGALGIACPHPAAFGAWQRQLDGIVGGQHYHFQAHYRANNVGHETRCIAARLVWM